MIPGMLDHHQNHIELKTHYKNLLLLDDFHIFCALCRMMRVNICYAISDNTKDQHKDEVHPKM